MFFKKIHHQLKSFLFIECAIKIKNCYAHVITFFLYIFLIIQGLGHLCNEGEISLKLNIFEDLKQIEINNSMFGMTLKVSLFFIDGLLIDTGPIRKQKQLTERLDRLPIEQLVLTNHHEDHPDLAFCRSEE